MAVGVTGSRFLIYFETYYGKHYNALFNAAALERFYHDIGIKNFSEKCVSDYYHSHNYFHSRKKRFFTYMMQFRLLATRGLLDTLRLNVREGKDFKIKQITASV